MNNNFDYQIFISNATTALESVMRNAQDIAFQYNAQYVSSEFILGAMVKSPDQRVGAILHDYGVTPVTYFSIMQRGLDPNEQAVGFTPRTKKILSLAQQISDNYGSGFCSAEHLLLAILSVQCVASQYVQSIVEDYRSLVNEVTVCIESFSAPAVEQPILHKTAAGYMNSDTPSAYGQYVENPYSRTQNRNCVPVEQREGSSALLDFGYDLTEKARLGKLDPVIGRDKEIDRVIQTLSRRLKSNPLLIGEPGIGKTAVVEGLAERIANGSVPVTLQNKTVFSLDLSGIVAGAKFKGQFEERLKAAIKFVEDNGDIILFIDEIHTIVSGGDGMGASEILKPCLARGDIQLVGATTIGEYRKYIEKDPALERRFQVVKLDPPRIEDCIEILRGIRDTFEAHHGIEIKEEAIDAAVRLSDRYITDRFLPDKAIDLIDEAAARARLLFDTTPETVTAKENQLKKLSFDRDYYVKTGKDVREIDEKIDALTAEIDQIYGAELKRRNHVNPYIDAEDVAKVVSEMTGIQVAKLTETEAQKLLNLENVLHKRVIGQNQAVESIAKSVRRAMTCVKDPQRPIGSFIFVGPTGVGKTELSKALAEALFGDENMLVRIDMSEYMEKASVSKLIGAPPGYVGYDEEGQLTEKVRRKPYSVILFDEIEKAHPDVFNIMLQILDDGRLTDNKGRTVDFKNTVIIMTSNEGAKEVKKANPLGFGENVEKATDELKERISEALKAKFRPEFLNRIDDIVIFRKLTMDECGEILDILCEGLKRRMTAMNVNLIIDASAKNFVLEKGYDGEYGARPLRRTVRNLVEDPLSEAILKGEVTPGCTVKVMERGGKIDFFTEK